MYGRCSVFYIFHIYEKTQQKTDRGAKNDLVVHLTAINLQVGYEQKSEIFLHEMFSLN